MAAGTLDHSGDNPLCIMIVDPEEQIHVMLQSALGDAGFTTLCTKNAAAARAQLGRTDVAVVIVEMMLRDTASALIRELQSRGVPTIAMCGHPEGIAQAQALGCPFLKKPFTIKELFRQVVAVMPVDNDA
jgi:DNA-binding response OmpR family regulator